MNLHRDDLLIETRKAEGLFAHIAIAALTCSTLKLDIFSLIVSPTPTNTAKLLQQKFLPRSLT